MEAPLSQLVRIKTAANMLGVTPQTVRNWVSAGRIRATRHPVNGYRLFDVDELERLVESTGESQPRQLSLIATPTQIDLDPSPVCFQNNGRAGIREIRLGEADVRVSKVTTTPNTGRYGHAEYDLDWLKLKKRPVVRTPLREIRIGDAFCGGGIFSVGVDEALRALNIKANHVFGIDFEQDAIDTFAHNFPDAAALHMDILSAANGEVGSPPTDLELSFLSRVSGPLDILVGGPPCQGHSDLNNHTRRLDPKNDLYFAMVRLAELLNPDFVLVENVPGVIHDKGSVVDRTAAGFRKLGYHVTTSRIDLRQIGVPQKRKRFVLVASKKGAFDIDAALSSFLTPARPISWAISDLLDQYDEAVIYESASNHSEENKRRINYLFAHDLYELPNSERPPCHRDKKHSYTSVYGRMRWDEPAPTITGGFGSTGQGRFVHPRIPRTLTPHEACRVQFAPDYFQFPKTIKRRSMQQIIGNAAPPKLSQVIVLGAALQGVLL